MDRVVITGIGAVTPLGNKFNDSWSAAKAAKSGIKPITKFDVSDLPWRFAGELKDFDAKTYLSQKETNRLDPFIQYAVAASIMAAEDAGLIERAESREQMVKWKKEKSYEIPEHDYLTSGGVIIGSSRGGISGIEKALLRKQNSEPGNQSTKRKSGNLHLSPYLMPSSTISMASSYAAQLLGIKGYCLGISNACASGANAIGEAYRLLKAGYRGPVIAGGSEAPVCRLCIEGYGVSGALSKINDSSASRPFDNKRDGFVLSEGACVIVLENFDSAVKRGANIYGEIIGYGNTNDAFHQTRPDSEGEARAIETAMSEAGVVPSEVDYISAHGTSTPLGDRVEAEAIKKIFGGISSTTPVSAVKSMTGHMLAASGALEAAFTVMSIKESIIPPSINLIEKDRNCDINVITEKTEKKINVALSNSFGFGGVNAVLVLKRFL